MLRLSAALVAPCLLALTACAARPASEVENARAALQEADAQYGKAGMSKNKDVFVAFYAPNAVVYPPGAATITGSAAIGTMMETIFKDPVFSAHFPAATVDVSADGSMGTTLAIVDLTTSGTDGKPMTEHARDFHVWRRQADGSWKIAVDIWNAEPVPATPAPAKD